MSKKLKCVLLIDDDEDDNFFHQIVIDRMKIADEVHIAESAEEALELLKEKKVVPDLIFLDINMPRMNGWEFMNEYNKLHVQQKITPAVVVILTTSVNTSEKEQSKKTPNIAGFISKPVNEKVLDDILLKHFS